MEITIRFDNGSHFELAVNSELIITGRHPWYIGLSLIDFVGDGHEVVAIACPKELVEELEEMFPHINIEMLEV